MANKEMKCQLKIKNLERRLPEMLDMVHGMAQTPAVAVLDFNETRRRKFPDGYYLYTIQERGNESHGVIIEKRTSRRGYVPFIFLILMDKWANIWILFKYWL